MEWAQAVIGSDLGNWYRLDQRLYRSAQPSAKDFRALETFGIRSVINLRNHHDDQEEAAGTGVTLFLLKTEADEISADEIEGALRLIRDAPPPVLVHCWHGSDRTGTVCAAYRIVFQGWTVDQALDELIHGGYGYHAMFDNIPSSLRAIDWETVRRRVLSASSP